MNIKGFFADEELEDICLCGFLFGAGGDVSGSAADFSDGARAGADVSGGEPGQYVPGAGRLGHTLVLGGAYWDFPAAGGIFSGSTACGAHGAGYWRGQCPICSVGKSAAGQPPALAGAMCEDSGALYRRLYCHPGPGAACEGSGCARFYDELAADRDGAFGHWFCEAAAAQSAGAFCKCLTGFTGIRGLEEALPFEKENPAEHGKAGKGGGGEDAAAGEFCIAVHLLRHRKRGYCTGRSEDADEGYELYAAEAKGSSAKEDGTWNEGGSFVL